MLNAKANAKSGSGQNADVSMFGKPKRLPQQLDESMLFDPKSIQFNPALRGIKNMIDELPANQVQSHFLVEQEPVSVKQTVSGYPTGAHPGRDSYVRPLTLTNTGFQESANPGASAYSNAGQTPNIEDEFRKMILSKEMDNMRGRPGSYRNSDAPVQRPTGGSSGYQRPIHSSDDILAENARLKVQNKALLAENGRRGFDTRAFEQTERRAHG